MLEVVDFDHKPQSVRMTEGRVSYIFKFMKYYISTANSPLLCSGFYSSFPSCNLVREGLGIFLWSVTGPVK